MPCYHLYHQSSQRLLTCSDNASQLIPITCQSDPVGCFLNVSVRLSRIGNLGNKEDVVGHFGTRFGVFRRGLQLADITDLIPANGRRGLHSDLRHHSYLTGLATDY